MIIREKTRPTNRNKTRSKKEPRSPSTSDEELQSPKQVTVKECNNSNPSVRSKPSPSPARSLGDIDDRRKKQGEKTPKQTPSRTPKQTPNRSSDVRKLPPPSPSESEDEEAVIPQGRVQSSSSASDGEIKESKPPVNTRPKSSLCTPGGSDDDSYSVKRDFRAVTKHAAAQSRSEDEISSVKPRIQPAASRETFGVMEKVLLSASDDESEIDRRRGNVSTARPKPPSPMPHSGSEERDGEWTRKNSKVQGNAKKAARGRSKARSGGISGQEEKNASGLKKEKVPKGLNNGKRSKDDIASAPKKQSGPGRPYPRRSQKSKVMKNEQSDNSATESSSDTDHEIDIVKTSDKATRPSKHKNQRNHRRDSGSDSDKDRKMLDSLSKRKQSSDSDRDSDRSPILSRPPISKVEESPPKLDTEGKAIQDKKKSDTLRKLFVPTKGGAKGGPKVAGKDGAKAGIYCASGGGKGVGAKGKGGSKTPGVLVVECESERTSSSVEDESVPTLMNPGLLSPLSNNDIVTSKHVSVGFDVNSSPVKAVKCSTSGKLVARDCSPEKFSRQNSTRKESEKPSKHSATVRVIHDTSSNKKNTSDAPKVELPPVVYHANGTPSIFCRLDLSRLSQIPIPGGPGKRPSGGEDIRVRTELADTRQLGGSDPDHSNKGKRQRTQSPSCEEGDIVIPKCDNNKNTDTVVWDHGCDSTVVNHEASKKQKKRRVSRNRDNSNSNNQPEVRDTTQAEG
jgi:hypothetical protein